MDRSFQRTSENPRAIEGFFLFNAQDSKESLVPIFVLLTEKKWLLYNNRMQNNTTPSRARSFTVVCILEMELEGQDESERESRG